MRHGENRRAESHLHLYETWTFISDRAFWWRNTSLHANQHELRPKQLVISSLCCKKDAKMDRQREAVKGTNLATAREASDTLSLELMYEQYRALLLKCGPLPTT